MGDAELAVALVLVVPTAVAAAAVPPVLGHPTTHGVQSTAPVGPTAPARSTFTGAPAMLSTTWTEATGMFAGLSAARERVVYPLPFQYWIVPAVLAVGAAVS